MSGHSKWHNIQKTKGAQDAKRAQAFTKIAREMIVAVKEGGSGDPNNNSRLAAVIAKAKAANMPMATGVSMDTLPCRAARQAPLKNGPHEKTITGRLSTQLPQLSSRARSASSLRVRVSPRASIR